MAIQDFNFSNKKSSNPIKKQAVISFKNEEDIVCLSSVLKKQRYHVLGESQQPNEIVELLRKNRYGIFFLDIDIEKISSMDFISKIKTNCPEFKVVLTANKMDKVQIEEAKKSGVVGFLAKPLQAGAVEKLLSKNIFD